MEILIVIVNYRTADLTIDCLGSLAAVRDEVGSSHVVVVDNASGDGSPQVIEEAIANRGWSAWASVSRAERNLGFAGGNNRGIAWMREHRVQAGYVLLLNSDTIVRPGALAHCIDVMEAERDVGMMCCQVLNRDATLQNVTRRFPTPLSQLACAFGLPWILPQLFGWANVSQTCEELLRQKRDCDWIGGAFMFIRREALDRLGGLDEDFFFYGEDIEFCYRFHRSGYRVHYDPAAPITHIGSASSDPTRIPAKARASYAWQARYLVQRKCYGAWAAWLLRAADVVAFALRKTRMICQGKRNTDQYRLVSDVLRMLVRPLRA